MTHYDDFNAQSSESLRSRFAVFVLWRGDRVKVRPDVLLRYHDFLKKKKYKAWTIALYMTAARRYFKWMFSKGYCLVEVVMPRVKTPRMKHRDLIPSDVKAALAKAPSGLREIATFIAETGCRPSEARRLRWENIHRRRRVALLDEHKTDDDGSVRTIPLPDAALHILEGRRCGRDAVEKRYVFMTPTGRMWSLGHLTASLRKVGVKSYDLRHLWAQSCLDRGVPLETIAAGMGHKGLGTVLRYCHVHEKILRAAAEKMESIL